MCAGKQKLSHKVVFTSESDSESDFEPAKGSTVWRALLSDVLLLISEIPIMICKVSSTSQRV